MIWIDIENLLNNKTKYWLCKNMNKPSHNLNIIINGETTSISFKYIENFCKYLNCNPNELIKIEYIEKIKN